LTNSYIAQTYVIKDYSPPQNLFLVPPLPWTTSYICLVPICIVSACVLTWDDQFYVMLLSLSALRFIRNYFQGEGGWGLSTVLSQKKVYCLYHANWCRWLGRNGDEVVSLSTTTHLKFTRNFSIFLF